ncbi:MAG: glycosyltransferase family 39 protein [Gluconacetobacter diazotrophicus]|nr:glycosyltransferase family 39 protein [Gluconacetobacter diazotrophicus]
MSAGGGGGGPAEEGVATGRRRGGVVPAAAFAILLGLVLRLYRLGAKPFWLDEVTTLHRAALPLPAMVRDSLAFHHLPTWFVISSPFLGFGSGEVALRLPAALFGALSCGLVAVVAGELAGEAAGPAAALLGGLLMAASPMEVQYGQEARSYTLVICCVLLAVHGLLRLLRVPERAALPWRRCPERGAWGCYVAGTLFGLLVLGVAIWWWLIANLAVGAAARCGRRTAPLPRAFGRRWLLVQAAIGAAATPGFAAMAVLVERAHGTFRSGLDWIPPLSWHHVGVALGALYGLRVSSLIADRLFASPVPWFGVAVPLLAIAGAAWLLRRGAVAERRAAVALLATTVSLPAATALVSVAVPLFMPRYLLWGTGPFLVLAGTGLAALPRRTRWAAGLLVCAAALVNLLPYYRTETKPRWEVAARMLDQRLRPGDELLIADPGAVDMMNVFLARRGAAIPRALWTADVAEASCALGAGRRVWAVFGRVGQVDHEDLSRFQADIAPLGPPLARVGVGMDITLMLFEPPGGGSTAAADPDGMRC